MTPSLGAVIVVGLFPYLLIRRSSVPGYARTDTAIWIATFAGVAVGRGAVSMETGPFIGLLVVARLVLFAVTLWTEGQTTSLEMPNRWRPATAAVFAVGLFSSIGAMNLAWPIDGDEPYYLLMAESIALDRDLDLSNQFESLDDSLTKRPDLEPQWGDQITEDGSIRSHHEPLLPLLLVLPVLSGSLWLTVATIALFGGGLVWSTFRWFEETGLDPDGRSAGFLALVFGSPVIWYSTRIWPEVPGAFFFVQALRALHRRSLPGVMIWAAPIMLLKMRFVPVGVVLIALGVWQHLRARPGVRGELVRLAPLLAVVVAVPFLVMLLSTGSGMGVHTLNELVPQSPGDYLRGAIGLMFDAQAGLLFQAPLMFLGLLVVGTWRDQPLSWRLGVLSVMPYVLLLLPRAEWHGGWSPPLRYLVVLIPLLAAGLAAVEDRLSEALLVIGTGWTSLMVWIGISWPWRLFHIADGESVTGEVLSEVFGTDFSRLLPSMIRPNDAVWWWVAIVVAGVVAAAVRWRPRPGPGWSAVFVVMILTGFAWIGTTPGSRVEIEDDHVDRRGGELYPDQWVVARFLYSGGWKMDPGDEVEFDFAGGPSVLTYRSEAGATILVGGQRLELPPVEGDGYVELDVMTQGETVRITLVEGTAVLDRIERR